MRLIKLANNRLFSERVKVLHRTESDEIDKFVLKSHAGIEIHVAKINQSIKTLIHVDRPQRDKVHMVKNKKIKSTMIHNNNNLNLNM